MREKGCRSQAHPAQAFSTTSARTGRAVEVSLFPRFQRFVAGSTPEQASGPPITVVGVVKDSKQKELRDAPPRMVYLPFTQAAAGRMTLVVRTDRNPRGRRSKPASPVVRGQP